MKHKSEVFSTLNISFCILVCKVENTRWHLPLGPKKYRCKKIDRKRERKREEGSKER
jgi:hypothetical protein